MQDEQRSKAELIQEVRELRMRVAELEVERGPGSLRLRQLLARIPALMWIIDRELRLTWWRGHGIDVLGLDAEATLGVSLFEFFQTSESEHPSIHAHRAALEGDSRTFELQLGDRWWSAHVDPLRTEDGIIHGAIGVGLEITERVRAEREREGLISDLQSALDDVKTLKGLIPICMHCKSMRDDKGYWQQVDTFVREHSDAELSHGICPDCVTKLLGPREERS